MLQFKRGSENQPINRPLSAGTPKSNCVASTRRLAEGISHAPWSLVTLNGLCTASTSKLPTFFQLLDATCKFKKKKKNEAIRSSQRNSNTTSKQLALRPLFFETKRRWCTSPRWGSLSWPLWCRRWGRRYRCPFEIGQYLCRKAAWLAMVRICWCFEGNLDAKASILGPFHKWHGHYLKSKLPRHCHFSSNQGDHHLTSIQEQKPLPCISKQVACWPFLTNKDWSLRNSNSNPEAPVLSIRKSLLIATDVSPLIVTCPVPVLILGSGETEWKPLIGMDDSSGMPKVHEWMNLHCLKCWNPFDNILSASKSMRPCSLSPAISTMLRPSLQFG